MISDPKIQAVLDALYLDALRSDPLAFQAARQAGVGHDRRGDREFFRALRGAYLPVSREFGKLLYAMARSTKAREIVEFGTSFGLSTIFLAAAVRDNGGGRVVTTEYEAEKVDRAKRNLADAGLVDLVEFRVGDALETLTRDLPIEVDMIFLDGAKGLYLDVLRRVEPRLRFGGLVAADNTDHAGLESFLEYLRDPRHGYSSTAMITTRGDSSASGHEVAVRVAERSI